MKIKMLTVKWAGWLAIGLIASGVTALPLSAGEAESEGGSPREKIIRLERKARELKAEGQHEQAEQAMRQAAELRALAGKGDRDQGPKASAEDQRRQELKRKLGEAQAELEELRAAGKEDAAAEMQMRVRRLQQELERPGKGREGEREGRPVRRDQAREGEDRPPGPQDPAAAQQRHAHLQAAIANLRAAGMFELAEKLAGEAGRMSPHLQGEPGLVPPMPPAPGPEMERLRNEVQELRQAVREMRARLDELGRDRR